MARNSFVAEVQLSKVSQHDYAQPRYLLYSLGSDETTIYSTLAARSSDSSCTITTFMAAREVYDMFRLDGLSCVHFGLHFLCLLEHDSLLLPDQSVCSSCTYIHRHSVSSERFSRLAGEAHRYLGSEGRMWICLHLNFSTEQVERQKEFPAITSVVVARVYMHLVTH